MAGGIGRRQQWLPRPNRANALWRGCLWAINCSYNRGSQNRAGTYYSLRDDVARTRGRLDGNSRDVVRTYDAGRFVCPGAAVDTPVYFDDVNNNYHWSWPSNVSLACLFRFNVVPADDVRILGKYSDAGLVPHPGVKLAYFPSLGNRFKWAWSDGVTEELITSTTIPVANVTYLLVGIRGGVRAALWVNGRREAVNTACAVTAGNDTAPIELFKAPSGVAPIVNGKIAMAALWERQLMVNDIASLNTNPFAMWLPNPSPLGDLEDAIDGCKCGGPWLHAWSGLG